MKLNKHLLILLVFVAFATTAMAQSSKQEKRATKQLTKLNETLTSADQSLALSAEQKSKLMPFYLTKVEKIDQIKQSDTNEDEQKEQLKAVRKETGNNINEILTKAQLKAKREAYRNSNKG